MRVTVTFLASKVLEAETEAGYINQRDELLRKFKQAGFRAEIEEEEWDGLEPDIVIAPSKLPRSKRPTLRMRKVKPKSEG